jgi:inosine-uridine nucleoside N-ribohydrolase
MLRLLAAFLFLPAASIAGREIVLFDTDSGLFGDDGAALVMLMRSPEQIFIPGITVVPGNVWSQQGAEYMLHILDLLKHPQTPVYTGAGQPLVQSAAMAREYGRRWGAIEFMGAFDQHDQLAVIPAPGCKLSVRKAHRDAAIQFLISQIESNPGDITILAIGPMTNIAMALRMKPDIETKIKRIVFMGGNLKAPGNASPAAEFNFWFDPEAARIVLRSRIPQKMMFALDICNTAPLHKAEFDQIANAHNAVAGLYREDLGNRYPGFLHKPDAIGYMWDSLAAAYLLDPGFVTKSEMRYLDVFTVWNKFYGSTVPLDRRLAPEATPVTFMLELDFKRVFALYKDKLTKPD